MRTRTGKGANRNGDAKASAAHNEKKGETAAPTTNGPATLSRVPAPPTPFADRGTRPPDDIPVPIKRVLAIFCFETPESAIGWHITQLVAALAARQTPVHLFCRRAFALTVPGVTVHEIGSGAEDGLIEQVNEFNSRACNAFLQQFPAGSDPVTVLSYEWSSVPALTLLQATRNAETILALFSLERQRSDMTSDLSRQIEEIELSGLRQARTVWVQQPATGEVARFWVPECGARLVAARQVFPMHQFERDLDPGRVKELYKIGPLDPTILYVGDLDERHGPDILMKSVPAVLRDYPQSRFVFVGDGTLQWPLRVIARYLLLEHAVRLLGHLEGRPLFDLIQAADVVVIPSRVQTEWWTLLAAWAARRPVVATHNLAEGLRLQHEQNSVLVYPAESSCVWGIHRLLHDWDLAAKIGAEGRRVLEERFGWCTVAAQLEDLMGVPQAT